MMPHSKIALALAFGLVLAGGRSLAGELKAPRVVVCTGVAQREPQGAATSFPASVGQVWCFTELEASAEGAITHVWSRDGREVRRISLAVREGRYRTWSQKNVTPGKWRVAVLDPAGKEIGAVEFEVGTDR